jgi:hypothetical protein
VTYLACVTILTSYSLRLVSHLRNCLGQCRRPHEIGEIVGQRMKLKPDGVDGNEQHDSRVHFMAFLPSLIHC